MTQTERLKASQLWREFNRRICALGLDMKVQGVPEDHAARVLLRQVLKAINQEQAKIGDMAPEVVK